MATLIVVCCLLLLLYHLYARNYTHWKSRGVPYEKPFFIFGSFYTVLTKKQHLSERIREIYNKYGNEPYVGTFMLNKPILLVRSTDLIKTILVKDFDKFMNRNIVADEAADPIAFHNLPSAKDGTWRNLRSKLSPVFSSGKIKLMVPLMKECAADLNLFLSKHSNETVELRMTMKKYAVDIISSCAFGIHSNCLKNEHSEVFDMATHLVDFQSAWRNLSIMCFFFVPKLVSILKLTYVDRTAAMYFIDIFKNATREREKRNILRNDLIDLLNNLKKNETANESYKFDDHKMASQAITFFSAGSETTSVTLSFVYYELAVNPDIQNRLRAEVSQVYEERGDFTYESLQAMKYLDMVLKETMRKYSLLSFLDRQAKVDFTFGETGFTVEKGTAIQIPVAGLHHDPEYFPNPEQFDPERFSDENKQNIKPFTYLPFGDGPRMCIGERFAVLVCKTALAYSVKDFAFEPSETTTVPLRLDPATLVMTVRNGVRLKVSKINF